VDDLVLPEAGEGEDVVVRLGGGGRVDLASAAREAADHAARLVDGLVLVQGVDVVLQVLGRLRQAERVEAAVAGQGAVEPEGREERREGTGERGERGRVEKRGWRAERDACSPPSPPLPFRLSKRAHSPVGALGVGQPQGVAAAWCKERGERGECEQGGAEEKGLGWPAARG
jgi:hypothetical protein